MNPTTTLRLALVLTPALSLAAPGTAWAQEAPIDLTMEVIGKDEAVDERLVNRIFIPGVQDRANTTGGAEAAETLQERRALRRERVEAWRERLQQRREERRDARQQ